MNTPQSQIFFSEKDYLAEEEYLAIERASEERHEYIFPTTAIEMDDE